MRGGSERLSWPALLNIIVGGISAKRASHIGPVHVIILLLDRITRINIFSFMVFIVNIIFIEGYVMCLGIILRTLNNRY